MFSVAPEHGLGLSLCLFGGGSSLCWHSSRLGNRGLFSGSCPSLHVGSRGPAGQALKRVAPQCLGRASSGPVPKVPDVPWPGMALDYQWPWPWQLVYGTTEADGGHGSGGFNYSGLGDNHWVTQGSVKKWSQ